MRARLLAATVAAVLLPTATASAGDPIMPLADVHAGMRCTGYSVVRGTEISSFDVDVIDVADGNAVTVGPRILVRVSGLAVDATGLGPGFSGSPIYCADAAGVSRNIGAISESIGEYGGRVARATPIEQILATRVDPPARGNPANKPAGRRARLPAQARPLAEPLSVSGLSSDLGGALCVAGAKARPRSVAGATAARRVSAAPAGPLGAFPPQVLRPGSAVGVGYSSGDIQ